MMKIINLTFLFVLTSLSLGSSQPWAEGVYYEIFVRSFQDSNGDGIGDLQGVIERLDYLEDLGVKGLWLMPIHPSPSYHGYDVTDYYKINPDYGTLEDFKLLIAEAHQRGIRIVMDLVVNHTSSEHPWFLLALAEDTTYRDYYLWSEGSKTWRGTGGGPAWHGSDSGFYLGLFWSGMPDLNYQNPVVVEEMNEIARFWLELGVDGFRLDAIQHIVESQGGVIRNTPETFAWLKDFEAYVKSVREDAFIVGETWTDSQTIARYHELSDLDMSFNYPLWGALLEAVQSRRASDLLFLLRQDSELYPQRSVQGTFISNHDQVRQATSLGLLRRDEARIKLAAGLLFALPGTPFLYYGEEIGMPNGPGERDEDKRTPMRWDESPLAGFSSERPWLEFSTEEPGISVAAQAEDPDSIFSFYTWLIRLRNSVPAIARGELDILNTENKALLAFIRRLEDQEVLIVANLSNKEAQFDLGVTKKLGVDLQSLDEFEGVIILPKVSIQFIELREKIR